MQSSPPVLRFKEGNTVVPGDRIGTIRQVLSGEGTYVKSNGHIYASLVGQLQITEITSMENNNNNMEVDEEKRRRVQGKHHDNHNTILHLFCKDKESTSHITGITCWPNCDWSCGTN